MMRFILISTGWLVTYLLLSPLHLAAIDLLFLLAGYGVIVAGFLYVERKRTRRIAEQLEQFPAATLSEAATANEQLYQQKLMALQAEKQTAIEAVKQQQLELIEYTATWMHEVKMPVAAIQLMLDEDEHERDDELREKLQLIEQYVEQALYFVRIDDFSNDYFIREQPLLPLVRTVVKQYASSFIRQRLQPHFSGDDFMIHSDDKWLSFIVHQLVSNAVKYSTPASKIEFLFVETATERQLHIRDYGIGIASEDVPRVFAKGFTGQNGRHFTKSTGLGLYLAEKMAHKLGHRLSLTSTLHEGTTVVLHFPRIREQSLHRL